jgi:F-type H+-transporting ATPase subunit b
VKDALKKRKAAIMQGIDEAAKMKDDAQARLTDLEDKIDHIEDEIERVRREMQDAGQIERERVLAEAKERRQRMERDARLLASQELKVARDTLLEETVVSAVDSAREAIEKALTPAEHRRLAEEYLAGLDRSLAAPGGAS